MVPGHDNPVRTVRVALMQGSMMWRIDYVRNHSNSDVKGGRGRWGRIGYCEYIGILVVGLDSA